MQLAMLSSYLWLAGFVIGLGAVSVIETLGWLGQRSTYWTETTIRTHKVTKPLIWFGLTLATVGAVWHFVQFGLSPVAYVLLGLGAVMIVNGSWLTFWLSPRLLELERQGQAKRLLPKTWKRWITLSFCVSIVTWWSAFAISISILVNG
ncbi:MAG: hypothetical protein WAZ14_02975 [Patescibacteria group bacterium]